METTRKLEDNRQDSTVLERLAQKQIFVDFSVP